MIVRGAAETHGTPAAPVPVSVRYDSFDWSSANDMPGNRPSIAMTLLGDDMWGQHLLEIRDAPGLQIREISPVWAGDNAPPEQMRGISFEIMIWPGVTPGVKTLWFNGQPIQFDITIADYPGAEPPGD